MAAQASAPTMVADAALADKMGDLYVQIEALQAEYDACKAAIVAHGATVQGTRFNAEYVNASTRWSLDGKAILAEMGEKWCTARSKLSNVSATARIKARISAVAA